MGSKIAIVQIDDSSNKIISGTYQWTRLDGYGGLLIPPQGTSFPSSDVATGEIFWRTDLEVLYRWDGSAWQPLGSSTVAAHASTHIKDGSDEIDGDQLDIDWNPSSYTPTTSPTEVTNVDHLTAHLAGIDAQLGAAITDHGALTGLGDNDHPQYLLVNGTDAMEGDLDLDGYNINDVGTINGVRYYGKSATNPVTPTPADGDLYYDTALDLWMFYDGTRSKWLSVEKITYQAGRAGATTAGTFYRGINGMVLSTTAGFPVQQGTIVGLELFKTSTTASTLDVGDGSSILATLSHGAAAGRYADFTVNGDISAGLLTCRNAPAGTTTQNVQILIHIRRRA